MTLLQTRGPTREPMELVLGSTAGRSGDDFFVMGYSHEYDRAESARFPEHEQSTFILRYLHGVRQVVQVLPQRLNDAWQSAQGRSYAVGEPRGVIEIDANGARETAIDDVMGTFASIWGTSEEHVFACGNHRSFWLYRRFGIWHRLPMPKDVGGLWRVCGQSETDVYAVSDRGEIFHFDGHHTQSLDSPTSCWLVAIAPLPDGRMCVAGHQGTLLHGDTRGWRVVDAGTDSPLLNIVPFLGGVCFVTADGVWLFDGTTAPRCLTPQGGRWLSSVGDRLLIVNNEQAWLWDGSTLRALDTTL